MTPLIAWLLPLAVSIALLVILATAVSNARLFPRLQPVPPRTNPDDYANSTGLPAVSVLIPARNEQHIIGSTVTALLTQTYPHLRVAVLDDLSTDGTAEVAQAAAAQATAAHVTAEAGLRLYAKPDTTTPAANFQLLCGQPLPSGWAGKNWACHQLAEHAAAQDADILLFTDADVQWQPEAVAAVVAEFQRSGADLLTVWPTQTTITWGERLTVPLMALVVLGYLPLALAQDFYHPLAAAANGQCLVFDRRAYTQIGGHAAVRSAIVEDVRLAQHIKAAGLHLRMADGNRLVGCRMYAGSRAAIDGYTKNILAGHGNQVLLLLLSTLFHWAIFIWPWLWLILGSPSLGVWNLPAWPLWPALLVSAGLLARAVTAAATQQRVADALLMPVSVLLMTWIALRALWWRWRYGGVLWKGRILHNT